MTALDDRPVAPAAPDTLASQRGELRATSLRESDAYGFGYRDGYEAGLRAAHAEMAQWWATLAATVRADANRLKSTVPEPVARSNGSSDDSAWFTAAEWSAWAGVR